ncbi:MAG: GGDEF domain-containing protein [Brevinematales bacterium]|jgi:diguanylate cyclase (GGDEF)-like protein
MKDNIEKWMIITSSLDFAFQPIVNTYTGKVFGVEALLRGHLKNGFESISSVFDQALADDYLVGLDMILLDKAADKFSTLKTQEHIKLFYNIDNRVVQLDGFDREHARTIMKKYSLDPNQLCFEISERHTFDSFEKTKDLLSGIKENFFKIAIDDFGTGFSGFEFLYHFEPDYIKIDRFFISNIHSDSKKRLLLSYLVNISHMLGILVIAEGIETENEYYFCKSIGCDLVQGFLLGEPFTELDQFRNKIEYLEFLNNIDKRRKTIDENLIFKQMEYIEPVLIDMELFDIFDIFKKNKKNTFFPVINKEYEPIGIISEECLKDYIYSPYGKEVLKNKTLSENSEHFVVKNPVSEVNTRIEKILELFAIDEDSSGIIITENGKYIGFLGAKELLKAIHEKNLESAMNQNPLTKLPGNNSIYQYISVLLEETDLEHILVYLDINNFKAFNDKYGFRQGDRALLKFSDMLAKISREFFIAHIGGDDFFAAFKSREDKFDFVLKTVNRLLDEFAIEILSLYSEEDRKRGYITSLNREGRKRQFPLLSACAVLLVIPSGPIPFSIDEISGLIGDLKKAVKRDNEKVLCVSVLKSGIFARMRFDTMEAAIENV